MKQSSLNGHYCIASKLHYDKLVKDGYSAFNQFTSYYPNFKFYYTDNDKTIIGTKDNIPEMGKFEYPEEPIHLHNNEWVFGSLEHEEVCDLCNGEGGSVVSFDPYMTQPCPSCNGIDIEEPKPVERITRIESHLEFDLIQNGNRVASRNIEKHKYIDKLFNYIEHLENDLKAFKDTMDDMSGDESFR